MARARFIRPEFFTDEKVSDLSFGACLLFAGVWCQADLRGVFECSPRLLRGLIFPMRDGIDTATIGQWLNDLERFGMFRRFEAQDKQWGQVTNWSRHQEVTVREVEIGSRRPTPSDWADPVEWSEIVEKARKNHRIAKSSPWNDSRTVPEPNQNPTPTATTTTTTTPPTPTTGQGGAGGGSPHGVGEAGEAGEADLERQRTEFVKMLRRLRVAEGAKATPLWWSLALDTKARTFEERLDAIWWAVTEGKARGIKVRFATDVEAIAMEWQPPKATDGAA